jgi:hypothetical protein
VRGGGSANNRVANLPVFQNASQGQYSEAWGGSSGNVQEKTYIIQNIIWIKSMEREEFREYAINSRTE